jgi:hypothetical protein
VHVVRVVVQEYLPSRVASVYTGFTESVIAFQLKVTRPSREVVRTVAGTDGAPIGVEMPATEEDPA